jgi:hypothetical protein
MKSKPPSADLRIDGGVEGAMTSNAVARRRQLAAWAMSPKGFARRAHSPNIAPAPA